MSLHLEERTREDYALYIDGDLQFDTADEAIYHESMALPALCLAKPANPEGLRVLICGGGDGLALRECLRFPNVTHVDLVDYDPEVVHLGQTRFANLNHHAFEDVRTTVHIADAWEFLTEATPYDVILCDFTVPRRPEDTRIFTQEWYARIKSALAPNGVIALNAVSPQVTPEAFWCLYRTVRLAGLNVLPYRVCIPSFRAHGYGAWGFLLAGHRRLTQSHLRTLTNPVPTRQADINRLWRGARFSYHERQLALCVPTHTLASPCLLELMLNPKQTSIKDAVEYSPTPDSRLPTPFDLEPLLRAIPITHPYHTREMIETLARQVIGTVRKLDIQRLVEALLKRATELPKELCRELGRLRDFLRERILRLEQFGTWSQKLFVTLVILMTLANSIAPDNAFAKGSFGLGHASMSRGYSGSFGGGKSGFSSTSRSGNGSFGGTRGLGGSFGTTGRAMHGSFGSGRTLAGSGFRTSYGGGRPTDIHGYAYQPRVFLYCGGGGGHIHPYYGIYGGHGGGGMVQNTPPPESHQTFFVADEDMLVMDNGDVIITLSPDAYLLIVGGTVSLMSQKVSTPLVALYPDPTLFQAIAAQLEEQRIMVEQQIAPRQDWLSWVGWTSSLFSSVQEDKTEIKNLSDLHRRLMKAQQNLVMPPATATPLGSLVAGQVELFADCQLTPEGNVRLRASDDHWLFTDGKRFWTDKPDDKPLPCPPELAVVLKSVLQKLQKEFAADLAATESDLRALMLDRTALERDLAEYQSFQNSYGSSYEVDYGTDEMAVSDAISRTNRDQEENVQNIATIEKERAKATSDIGQIVHVMEQFSR